ERKLGAEVLLKAARATTDEEPDPISRAVQRARELAARLGTAPAGPLHLLLSLIHDRKSGAHRALAQCGVDVARLRAAGMQIALGRIGPRRIVADHVQDRREATAERGAQRAEGPSRATPGIAISLLPPPKSTPPNAPPGASVIGSIGTP